MQHKEKCLYMEHIFKITLGFSFLLLPTSHAESYISCPMILNLIGTNIYLFIYLFILFILSKVTIEAQIQPSYRGILAEIIIAL